MKNCWIEISKKKIKELGRVRLAVEKKWYTVWDEDRIRKAFNFGNGTMVDFKRYMENNKPYCVFAKR